MNTDGILVSDFQIVDNSRFERGIMAQKWAVQHSCGLQGEKSKT
jgi:hypothetical protein